MTLGITIRLGAGTNTVSANGHTFDRTSMDKTERNKLRRLVVEAERIQQTKKKG